MDLLMRGYPLDLTHAILVQRVQPLHWIIDTAPIFLGGVASVAGKIKDSIDADITSTLRRNTHLESELGRVMVEQGMGYGAAELINRLVDTSDMRMGGMLDSTPSCFKIIDSAGHLLFMNRTGLDLVEAEDMASVFRADVYQLVEPSHRDAFIAFNERICGGATESLRFEIVGLGGTRRWMESWAAPYVLQNGEQAHVAVTNDISVQVLEAQKLAAQEEALMRAQKLAAVGEFAAGIGHEINNPLTIIAGTAGLLSVELEAGDLDPSSVRAGLREIEETVARIRRITDGVKAFARYDDSVELSELDLRDVIEGSVELCSPVLLASDVSVDLDVPANLVVTSSKVQVEQVLVNLILNALHAVEPLEDRWISLRAEEMDGDVIRIELADSGRLTDPEVVSKIFTPFFTTKDVGEGTGLGLSISLGLIEGLGGTLKLDGDAETTTFVIELPVAAR